MSKNKLIIILLLVLGTIIIYNFITETMSDFNENSEEPIDNNIIKNKKIHDPSKLIEITKLPVCNIKGIDLISTKNTSSKINSEDDSSKINSENDSSKINSENDSSKINSEDALSKINSKNALSKINNTSSKINNDSQIIYANYGINTNPINNNNISIFQEISDPQLHTVTIGGKDYYLTQVEFKKSNLSWNNKPVGLELHLIHTDYTSMNNIKIILPLDLTDTPSIISDNNSSIEQFTPISDSNVKREDFTNVLYTKFVNTLVSDLTTKDTILNNAENIIDTIKSSKNTANIVSNPITNVVNNLASAAKKIIKSVEHNLYDLTIKYNLQFDIDKLNNLIDSNIITIPEYSCCSTTIGSLQSFYLCEITNIINNMPKYYVLKEQSGSICYLSHPVPFNTIHGNLILNNIVFDSNKTYIKESEKRTGSYSSSI